MLSPTIEQVQDVMARKGYAFFERGLFNLNIIGVRESREATNLFDDTLLLCYKDTLGWMVRASKFTTDPGKGPLESPPPKGRAILKPGQYLGCYKLGMHKGKQEALVQVKPVTVYRDRTGDAHLDYVNEETGLFGINIHWSNLNWTSTQVDNWSEGCQVGTGPSDYKAFIELCRLSAERYGNSFTYTLLEREDFHV